MIIVLSGTNRPGSNTLKVARIIESYYRDMNQEAEVLSLEELPPEIYDPAAYAEKPAAFTAINDRILKSSGLHVVIPEYNGSFPGVLKYFIDMLKFPDSFEQRCVAFTGLAAGSWGGLRPVEQMQMIFGYRNARIMPERVWIPGIGGKLADDGKSITDENLTGRLKNQARKFVDFVKCNKGHTL
jgi:chromate reductase, NAD(P)H dehydrogenase (quinone)